jgi:hypothetical protein
MKIFFKFNNNRFSQLLILFIMLIVATSLLLTSQLVQQNQENRSSATEIKEKLPTPTTYIQEEKLMTQEEIDKVEKNSGSDEDIDLMYQNKEGIF